MFGNRLNAHFPWFLLMVLITIQSSMSGFDLPSLGLKIEDKLVHFLVFGVLGWLLIRGMTLETQSWIHQHRYHLALTLGILFAISDELHQALTFSRNADVFDLLADVAGIGYFVYLFNRKQKRLTTANLDQDST